MKKILNSTLIALSAAVVLSPVSLTAKGSIGLDEAKLVGNEAVSTPYGDVTIEHNLITKGSQELFLQGRH